MDIEERMSKAEADIAALKETQRLLLQGQAELRASMERGFAEQRSAMAELRASMDRGFAEQRVAIAEERAARERSFRWTFSAILSILALVLGIIARLAGAW